MPNSEAEMKVYSKADLCPTHTRIPSNPALVSIFLNDSNKFNRKMFKRDRRYLTVKFKWMAKSDSRGHNQSVVQSVNLVSKNKKESYELQLNLRTKNISLHDFMVDIKTEKQKKVENRISSEKCAQNGKLKDDGVKMVHFYKASSRHFIEQ